MKWLVVWVCAVIVLGIAGLYGLRANLRTNSPGAVTETALRPPLPAPDAEVSEYRKIAYETCEASRNDWISLSQMLGTRATPEAIARGYARYAQEPAVYDACLRGFRG